MSVIPSRTGTEKTGSPGKAFGFKVLITMLLLTAGFVFLVIKLFEIQITDFKVYRQKVVDQLTYEGTIPSERGLIYSADGELLAANTVRYRIFIDPTAIQEEMAKIADGEESRVVCERPIDEEIADGLSVITGVSAEKILEMSRKLGRLDETVLRSADSELAGKVREYVSEHRFERLIYLEGTSERYYIYGDFASHLLGFTGRDGYGLYGLEYYYNEELTGTDGRFIAATDAGGRVLPYEYETRIPAENGNNLYTTINRRVQTALAKQVKKAYEDSEAQEGACGIVMNVKTGAVLGMATYPDFDCNNYSALGPVLQKKLADSGYEEGTEGYELLRNSLMLSSWSNMAVSYSYIPGSTFKPVTAAIALETDSVKLTDTFYCSGQIVTEDRLVHCSVLTGHGLLNFAQGLQQSCNPWFIHAGQAIGTAVFYDHFKDFGYLDKTGIDLPGEGATQFWARNEFTKINLSMCAFGQNFKISPIRHLSSLAAIANGGYTVNPYVVEKITDAEGNVVWRHTPTDTRQAVSASAASTVANILAEGVAGNGGSRNAYVAGYRVAAKTGTSEKIGDNEEDRICSCMAFAPVDDPEIIMILMVDTPTKGVIFGSTIAAPYVSATLAEILPELGIEPVYTEAEAAKLSVTVLDWVGSVSFGAKNAVEALGLTCETVGVGTVVTAQFPEAGSTLSKKDGRVVLYLGDEKPKNDIRVP
ncbi:MAG: PASTA domain-containing protein, partial [Clostridia bacterium]|nr:PASTA domain-containing protein [Clostridia bacterium]